MFITLEGPDGSGKSTQASLLKSRLEKQGKKVELIHFPRQESQIGGFIYNILLGDVEIDFSALQMLYVADQLDFQKDLNELLDEGYYVIADRYDMSTIAYYMSKTDSSCISAMQLIYDKWQTGLRKPDVTFVFSVEDHISSRLDADKLDMIESDETIVKSINTKYSILASRLEEEREIVTINANDSIESISIEIVDTLINIENHKQKINKR